MLKNVIGCCVQMSFSAVSLDDQDWASLPEDILLMVLDITQEWGPRTFRGIALNISSTCTHWKRIMDEHVTELRVKAIWNKPFEALMQRMPHVCTIKLDLAKEEVLQLLPNYPKITHLDIRGAPKIAPHGLRAISFCPWLRVLKLPDLSCIESKDALDLSANTSLEHLDMNGCDILEGGSLTGLVSMPNLFFLDLGDCCNLGSDSLCVLPLVTSLTSLNLTNVRGVNDELLNNCCRLTNLKNLNLQGCRGVSNGGVAALSKLPALQRLNLSQCPRVSEVCVAYMAQLTSLTDLDMSQCRSLDESGVEGMFRLASLKKLNISGLEVTMHGLEALSRLESLEELYIRGCQISSWSGTTAFKKKFSAVVFGP